mmetsp:Transcript_10417/g.32104  ORF Transcript_10417/g.32104 Transcript_10417/m.32104 type:complete len:223 (+) Transcript_10417:177-845(+)
MDRDAKHCGGRLKGIDGVEEGLNRDHLWFQVQKRFLVPLAVLDLLDLDVRSHRQELVPVMLEDVVEAQGHHQAVDDHERDVDHAQGELEVRRLQLPLGVVQHQQVEHHRRSRGQERRQRGSAGHLYGDALVRLVQLDVLPHHEPVLQHLQALHRRGREVCHVLAGVVDFGRGRTLLLLRQVLQERLPVLHDGLQRVLPGEAPEAVEGDDLFLLRLVPDVGVR